MALWVTVASGWPQAEGEAGELSPGQLAEGRSRSQLLGPPRSPGLISNAEDSQNSESGGASGDLPPIALVRKWGNLLS